MKKPYKVVLATAITLITGVSFGQTRYVAATGTDASNDCTLPGNPCATINAAYSEALPGDSIVVAAGDYLLGSTLTIAKNGIVLTAQDSENKPVLTSVASDVISVDASGVSISNLVLEMGLTANTGLRGIVSNGNFNNLTIAGNEFVSVKPISTGMVFGAYAVSLSTPVGTAATANIEDNVVRTEGAAYDFFGRGFGLGLNGFDGPSGTVINNQVYAYYAIQAIRNTDDLTITGNELKGITMVNYPINDALVLLEDNTFDGVSSTLAANLYAILDIRAIEAGSVDLVGNTVQNYSNIGVLSMASKNVALVGNTFLPLADAANFVSIMANTKLMTSGVQGNTFSDEITIVGNTFNAGAANGGTAIVFADHYGANTPAFELAQIGGAGEHQQNVFATGLGKYIALDAQTGTSTAYPLWAGYSATTMQPMTQDITALGVYNDFGFADFADIEAKNTDQEDNATLGKVILFVDGTNRYVAADGSDAANNCTLPGNPCATIAHAYDMAATADSIIVAGGDYVLNATLAIAKDEIVLTAQDINNKPVITTTASDVITINADDVTINGLQLEMGLTATTGLKGIVSAGSFDGLTLTNNELISTKPLSTGMVFGAYAVSLNATVDSIENVVIENNVITTAGAAYDFFGRGLGLGMNGFDGPGGLVNANDIQAYYPIQAVRTGDVLEIFDNNVKGITMVNYPLANVTVALDGNTFDGVNATLANNLYALLDIRAIEIGNVELTNNTIQNYATIGLLSMATKNFQVDGNTFSPLADANAFVSLMANTKLMTNGVQGNTYSDEIIITGNTFNAGAANGGTAIVFADHYGMNTPAFMAITIGGTSADEKNTFDTDLGHYIVLDDKEGSSATYPLWAPYSVTTMKPFTQDVTALEIHNVYGQPDIASIEGKNTDSLDNAILGKVILFETTAGIEENAAIAATLYPNPATATLTIALETATAANVTIVDLVGNVVYNNTISATETIDVQHFTAGVYLVNIQAGENVYSTKVVKK